MIERKPMLSRVADSLYWMSRYLERAENTARLLDVHLNLMLDMQPGLVEQQRLNRLLDSLSTKSETQDTESILRSLTFNPESQVSVKAMITAARENARQIREQISSEMWMQINKLYLHIQQADADDVWRASPHDFYLEVKEGSHLFQGITDATMNHNQGWQFIQIGRYMERIFGLLKLLDAHFRDPDLTTKENVSINRYFELVATLKSVSAFEAYCKVYNPNLQPFEMIEFLLFNDEFPRSIRFCLDTILKALYALSDATGRSKNTHLYRIAGRLQSNLSYDDINDIHHLHDYLDNIQQQMYRIHDTLYDTYVTYPIETAL